MSFYESFHLRCMGILLAGYVLFAALMTDGAVLGSRSPAFMLALLFGLLAVIGVLFGGMWILAMRSEGTERVTTDEREDQIDLRAERTGYRLTDSAIFLLILLVLGDAAGGGLLGSYSLTRPEAVVFALVTLSAIGGIGRFAVGFIVARTS